MDVRCPACNKLYPKVDFSFAGRKFGCECGHKFFLSTEPGETDTRAAGDARDTEDAPEELDEAGATALMDVVCPQCHKTYTDVDASLVGNKFGCECGHKFFLRKDGKTDPADGPGPPKDEERAPRPRPPAGEEDGPQEDTPPRSGRPDSPVVREPREIGFDDVIEDPPLPDPGMHDEPPVPAPVHRRRRAARTGNFLVGWILNVILIALLISLAYFGYRALTGQLEVPFKIKLELEDTGD